MSEDDFFSLPAPAFVGLPDEGDYGAQLTDDAATDTPLPFDPAQQRRAIAQGFQALNGDEPLNVADTVGDVISSPQGLALWAAPPNENAVLVIPHLDDPLDPDEWLDALEDIDAPEGLERALSKVVSSGVEPGVVSDKPAHHVDRADFAQRMGETLRAANIDAIAMQRPEGGGYDWIIMNAEDLGQETNGEPWQAIGGIGDTDLTHVGVSLGMGGQVKLWPAPHETGFKDAPAALQTRATR